MSNTVSGTQYETADGILRTLIAWELVGLSVNELYELAREWDSPARLGATPADRRYARAIVAAANGLAGNHHSDGAADSKPIQVTYRGDLHDIMEAARDGLETADDPQQWP